eukprot:SM000072S21202  [mRNA]  locus=s72:266685:269096:- [translate_table: standard]
MHPLIGPSYGRRVPRTTRLDTGPRHDHRVQTSLTLPAAGSRRRGAPAPPRRCLCASGWVVARGRVEALLPYLEHRNTMYFEWSSPWLLPLHCVAVLQVPQHGLRPEPRPIHESDKHRRSGARSPHPRLRAPSGMSASGGRAAGSASALEHRAALLRQPHAMTSKSPCVEEDEPAELSPARSLRPLRLRATRAAGCRLPPPPLLPLLPPPASPPPVVAVVHPRTRARSRALLGNGGRALQPLEGDGWWTSHANVAFLDNVAVERSQRQAKETFLVESMLRSCCTLAIAHKEIPSLDAAVAALVEC